jgi:hypothetical protein
MTNRERRAGMALDEVYNYCRDLETREERPEMFKLCAAIRTVDAAIETAGEARHHPIGPPISLEAWQRIRNSLFDFLVTSFPGYFLVYRDFEASPLEPGSQWPEEGLLEFFPEQGRRREDSYFCELGDLNLKTRTSLRWCFAEGRQNSRPADFSREPVVLEDEQANDFLMRLNEVCADEATKGKKRAHQKWWQLYWESNSCRDREEKRRLHKDMDRLQSVWGRPS